MNLTAFTQQMIELRTRAPARYAIYAAFTMPALVAILIPVGTLLGGLLGAVAGAFAALLAVIAFGSAILAALIPREDLDAALDDEPLVLTDVTTAGDSERRYLPENTSGQ